jgi:hypothetical protein
MNTLAPFMPLARDGFGFQPPGLTSSSIQPSYHLKSILDIYNPLLSSRG